MQVDEVEAAALMLDTRDRARLAERLLASLEDLSEEKNALVWAEEAQRRADAVMAGTLSSREAADVLREARARL